MNIIKTDIEDVLIIEPKIFGDERGYFYESYNTKDYTTNAAITDTFVQDNESKSCYGVIRGLHFQLPPYAQSKLVRVVQGKVIDVAVDIRRGSPTYGKHVAIELSEQNHRQLYIPQGFAHGFAVLSEVAIFQYKCNNYYHPEAEAAIAWNDPDLAINWHIPTSAIILSEKDKHHPTLSNFSSPFKI